MCYRFICIQEDRSCLLCSLVDLERKELQILFGQRDKATKQDSIRYKTITDADNKGFIVPGTSVLLPCDGGSGYRNSYGELLSLPPVVALSSTWPLCHGYVWLGCYRYALHNDGATLCLFVRFSALLPA
ncbi:hypothetical protein ACQJBY_035203 [Aegilops geniculata]